MYRNYLMPLRSNIFDANIIYYQSLIIYYQCSFRKGTNPQYCLIAMLEKWNLTKDKDSFFGALLTDLSKVFDCFSHEFLIVELAAYGFSQSALKLMYTYLFDRKQRSKVDIFYSP